MDNDDKELNGVNTQSNFTNVKGVVWRGRAWSRDSYQTIKIGTARKRVLTLFWGMEWHAYRHRKVNVIADKVDNIALHRVIGRVTTWELNNLGYLLDLEKEALDVLFKWQTMGNVCCGLFGGDWDCFSFFNSSAIRLVRETIIPDTSEENKDVLKKSILFHEMIVKGHYQRQFSENWDLEVQDSGNEEGWKPCCQPAFGLS